MKQKEEFFAKVLREPVLQKLEGGGYRFCFFPRKRYLAECICMALFATLFAYFISERTGWVAFLVLVPIAGVYVVMAVLMARLDRTKHVMLDGNKLLSGAASDELLGTIKGVFVLSLSGVEDKENWENGSERLYLVFERDGRDESIFPFIFAQIGLEKVAKEIARIAGRPYRWVWGLGNLPKELHDRI